MLLYRYLESDFVLWFVNSPVIPIPKHLHELHLNLFKLFQEQK